jgi:predicted RNase H-like HicB family nuclease
VVDEQLTIRVPRALARALARRARAEGVKRSHLVRQALLGFLRPAATAPERVAAVREPARGPYADRGVLRYKVALRRSEEGYSVSVPGLPGCWSQGETEAQALANIRDAIREYLAVRDELLRGATIRHVAVG